MSEQQIAKLVGVLVEHQKHFGSLTNAQAQWAIQNTPAAIALFVKAIKTERKRPSMVGAQIRTAHMDEASVLHMARLHSAEYAGLLDLSNVDIEKMEHMRKVVEVTTVFGQVYLVPKNTCGSSWGGTWEYLLQVRPAAGSAIKTRNIGGGTSEVSVVENEMFTELVESIVDGKTKVVDMYIWP